MSDLPRLASIAPGRSFVAALARGVMASYGADPLALADITILLPTRRSARALREAFLRETDGQGLLLPRMRPLGDVPDAEAALGDMAGTPAGALDLPPAMAEPERTALLARLVAARRDLPLSPAGCWRMGAELGRLIDQVHTERLSFDDLDRIVPDSLAEHWQDVVQFLDIARQAWPDILAARGAIDAADRRDRLLTAQAAHWRDHPPAGPVIAAGSTGSLPATADLIATVAGLPTGHVVLPGLDRALDAESWDALDATHPQFGMARLLERLEVGRDQVADWPASADPGARQSPDRSVLLREMFRPAKTTPAWQNIQGLKKGALDGLRRIETATRREEAETIALLFREALEQPGRTATLVTPDRVLARRVAAAMDRWGVAVDDSAGRPLGDWPVGAFIRLIARAAADRAAPVAFLAMLKHPLSQAGLPRAELLELARIIDRALRGLRPPPGLDALAGRVAGKVASASPGMDRLIDRCGKFFDLMAGPAQPAKVFLQGHLELAEDLAERPGEPGALALWRGEDGEEAAELMSRLPGAWTDSGEIAPGDYAGLIDAVLADRPVRPRHAAHPRLAILGPLEARLDQADLMILGGLNEGTWPADSAADPWMSRAMRQKFGLPPAERRVGLAAHDVAQIMAGGEVVMTRAKRVDGAPSVASRWWLRLDAVLDAAAIMAPPTQAATAMAAALDRPDGPTVPAPAPEPRPPAEARPKSVSVTDVGLWMVDPYAFYAKRMLKLKELDPLDADPGPADRGIIVHQAIGDFIEAAGDLPLTDRDAAVAALVEHGRVAFGRIADYPGLIALWWPRFERLADAFVAAEAEWRERAAPLAVECDGTAVLEHGRGRLTLIARADRIDALIGQGDAAPLVIIDYKTGKPPSQPQVLAGVMPQLPLEAVIARRGSFVRAADKREIAKQRQTAGLAYWHLDGKGAVSIEMRPTEKSVADGKAPDLATVIDEAEAGLIRLAHTFAAPDTPYRSQVRGTTPAGEAYAHLARVGEWGGQSGGDA